MRRYTVENRSNTFGIYTYEAVPMMIVADNAKRIFLIMVFMIFTTPPNCFYI